MSFAAICMIALALAMDATAVAAVHGAMTPKITVRQALAVAGLFGGAHAAMPAVGAILGAQFGVFVQPWDHWIAFGLLALIGGNMIFQPARSIGGVVNIVGLALATSIDSLAVGVTLPMIGAPVVASIATIGIVTAVATTIGLYAGHQLGARFHRRLGLIGGIALLLIGLKIVIDHVGSGT